jgi:hypothetical protein
MEAFCVVQGIQRPPLILPGFQDGAGGRAGRDHERGWNNGETSTAFGHCKKFNLKVVSIKDLIEYRLKTDSLVEEIVRVNLPTKFGTFKLVAFKEKITGGEHLALIKGEWKEGEPVLTRVHSSCFTGDILGSFRCDCGEQLHKAMQMVEDEGKGAILYMNQEGRGIGLMNKVAGIQVAGRRS